MRIFGPKRDEVSGQWRKLRTEKLHDVSSPNTIRVIKFRMRRAGHVARMKGKRRAAYRVLVGKREGKRSIGRPRRRCLDNIKTDLQEVGLRWHGMDRSDSG